MKSLGQFNFAWIFALIVGGSILVLAIYGAVSAGNTQRGISDTEVAQDLAILTDPLQAGFSDGTYNTISFIDVTRINNYCFDDEFGRNELSVSTRSDVLEEWTVPGVPSRIGNKYIFSEDRIETELLYSFSKPFEFPYKVADLIFLTGNKYCFIGAPDRIASQVSIAENINTSSGCSKDESFINVCFGSGPDCDIEVFGSCRSSYCETIYDEGTVSKKGVQLKYVGSLMYGAIFSSEEIYTCNFNRLMYRTGRVAEVFSNKASIMNLRGCNTNLRGEIASYGLRVSNASLNELSSINYAEIDRRNDLEVCGLW